MSKNQQLRVDLVNNGSKLKNKNTFANSFVFSDLSNDNEFAGLRQTLNLKDEPQKPVNNPVSFEPKQSKLSQQSKPQNNPSTLPKAQKSKPIQQEQISNHEQDEDESPRKKKNKKQKRQRRKLFEQEEMNNTFMNEPEESYSKQNNKSPAKNQNKNKDTKQHKKNSEAKNIKNHQETEQESPQMHGKNQWNAKQRVNKQKAKNETIQIEEPTPKPSKLGKNNFHIQTLQTPSHPTKQSYKIIENPQKDKQLTKISQIESNHKKLNNDIKDIRQNYDSIEHEEQILFKRHNPRKQNEIRDFLTKKRLQKEHRQKKITQIREREKQAIAKSAQEIQIQKQKQKQEKIKQIKEIDYVKPKQRRQSLEQSNEQGTRLASQLIQKFKNQEPVHVKNQRKFNQIKQKQKQQEQQILLQRKQRYQSLDLEELQEHKRQYEERKQEMENMKKQYRQEQWNKINEDNQLLRDNIWKGPSHDIVDEELMEQKRKKKEPKEKVKKMKNYYEYIKNNFLPKTHQPKRSSLVHDQRVSESVGNYSGRYHGTPDGQLGNDPNKRHVKKYKYYQGNAVGTIIQSVPVARSYSEQKKIGQGYLEHLKSMPKKYTQSDSTTQIDPMDLEMIHRKFNTITKVKREPLPFYEQETKKRTVSISAKPTKDEVKLVYDQLKNEDLKLKSKRQLIRVMKHNSPGSVEVEKELNAGMLLNMERKLDLLAKLG